MDAEFLDALEWLKSKGYDLAHAAVQMGEVVRESSLDDAAGVVHDTIRLRRIQRDGCHSLNTVLEALDRTDGIFDKAKRYFGFASYNLDRIAPEVEQALLTLERSTLREAGVPGPAIDEIIGALREEIGRLKSEGGSVTLDDGILDDARRRLGAFRSMLCEASGEQTPDFWPRMVKGLYGATKIVLDVAKFADPTLIAGLLGIVSIYSGSRLVAQAIGDDLDRRLAETQSMGSASRNDHASTVGRASFIITAPKLYPGIRPGETIEEYRLRIPRLRPDKSDDQGAKGK